MDCFEYNGLKSSDVGYYIMNFDGANSGEIDHSNNVVWNTSNAINSNEWNTHGTHYDSPIVLPSFQIGKYDCQKQELELITPIEQAFLKRWLERKDSYKFLRFFEEGYENIYYQCAIQVKWYKINGGVYGATLSPTCNSTCAYSQQQVYGVLQLDTNGQFTIYNDSDETGQLDFDQIEIEALGNGEICIQNDKDLAYNALPNKMRIKNCTTNEIIIIDGKTKQIKSNMVHQTLPNDYNYNPLRLINYDMAYGSGHNVFYVNSDRQNIFTNLGVPVSIHFSYRTKRIGAR